MYGPGRGHAPRVAEVRWPRRGICGIGQRLPRPQRTPLPPMLTRRLFGSVAGPAAATLRVCCSAARPAAAVRSHSQQGVARRSALAVRHSSSGSKGWKASEPDLAHDIAYQCPPGASLHAYPEGFDATTAAVAEAERYSAIDAMTQPEAEVSARFDPQHRFPNAP
jgi:hypothetical protein